MFDVLLAVKPLVMVLLGGLGTIFGPAIGALILIAFEEFVWRNFLTIHAAALGLIIVVLVLFLPNGLLSAVARAVSPAVERRHDRAARTRRRVAAVRRAQRRRGRQLLGRRRARSSA